MNLEKSFKVALAMRGMTQTDLGELMGVHRVQVNRWVKRGEVSKQRLAEICEKLDMKVSEFIAFGEE